MKLNAYLGAALAVLLTSCTLSPERSPSGDATAAELADLDRADCVDEYDPTVDYFPVKVEPQYAQGFSVDYHNHYKVVTVRNPWRAAT
ncbi:MAG: ABC transporter substrate-binding protein, partial [Cyanobacteria bacterium P01_C01_bin.118]